MIIYIYGEDTFRSRQFLKKSISEFKTKRDPQGFNTLIFNALTGDSERIVGELVTLPFLAEKRMIVVENLLSSKDENLLGNMSDLISKNKLPDVNVCVIWQAEAGSRLKAAKELTQLLEKEKYVYEFSKLSENELPAWITKETKQRGGAIDRAAAYNLAQAAGSDMWLVNSLIDQLIAYRQGEEIMSADISLFLDEKIDDNIFNMVDAITAGNKKLAFKLISDQRRAGQDNSYLFAMILRQIKILMQIRDLWEREDGLSSEELAGRLKLHPFVVKKSLPLIKRFNMNNLREFYDDLLRIDKQVKTGLASQDLLLDFFIGKI